MLFYFLNGGARNYSLSAFIVKVIIKTNKEYE